LRELNPMHPKPIREGVETLTRLNLWRMAAVSIAVALSSVAAAHAVPIDARVIWSRGDRAYMVARDSVWVSTGSSLRFFEKKKEIASGVVMLIEDSTLVVARITSGSLARVKHLDRIRVDAERGASAAKTALRVGYPSRARVQPFFECRRMVLEAQGYRVDTLGERSYRLVRSTPRPPEPDTLQVRLFDDAADEEIALERGELDAAVFWPGEASNHIRESMRWGGTPKPIRARGFVGLQPIGPVDYSVELVLGRFARREQELFDRLNADLFRGDLVPSRYTGPDSLVKPSLSFEIDSTLPGRESIQRVLGRAAGPPGRWTLTFFEAPTDGSLRDHDVEPTFWLFLVGCPVISRPELRPYLDSIDLSAIVNLFDCETSARKP
jgi:hypothetical protein